MAVGTRRCKALNQARQPCGQAPLKAAEYCLWHSPEHVAEAAEARRLGGLRRRREKTVGVVYEVGDLNSVADIQRLVKIAVVDTLSLENSIARSRALAYLAQTALKVLEAGELEDRVERLETQLDLHSSEGSVAPVSSA